MHIHLTPTGGIAGDMFVAAMLDTWPDLGPGLARALDEILATGAMPQDVCFTIESGTASGITGTRFHVAKSGATDHHHRALSEIRTWLSAMPLAPTVRDRAVNIFELLAEAEGHIHGVPTNDVSFHEVGAWDSVIDIVAAVWCIDAVGAATWSTASLPLGSGTVQTAHGILPVPAPATARLMRGFRVHDDGRAGERVTPTGMAILCHLQPGNAVGGSGWKLERTGFGLGTRKLDGIPNALGVLAFERATGGAVWERDDVAVIEFEVDDQTAEDLALGLDALRKCVGVIDVHQSVVFGKKGRVATSVRVLAQLDDLDAVIGACFVQTTTIGVRHRVEQRAVLMRDECEVDGRRVKVVARPGGVRTGKVESADLAGVEGGAEVRAQIRNAAAREICE